MLRFVVLLAIGATALACSSTPPPGPVSAAVSAADTESADAERDVICRKVQRTGTRMRTRTCLTAEQWEAIQRSSQEALDEIQRRSRQHREEGS